MSETAEAPNAQFVYLTYIRATPEQVWAGLIEPEFTRQYWMHDNRSDWKKGSSWDHRRSDGEGIVDIVGEVLESDHPHRLVLSWVPPKDESDPAKVSKVTFTIDQEGIQEWPHGPWTRLTVAHTEMEADSDMLHSVSFGWPAVVAGLKTVLETGGFE